MSVERPILAKPAVPETAPSRRSVPLVSPDPLRRSNPEPRTKPEENPGVSIPTKVPVPAGR